MPFTVYYFFVMSISLMKQTFIKLKHILAFAFIFTTLFISGVSPSCANTALKITDIVFDNSDNLVLIKSSGKINTNKVETQEDINYTYNEIKKGFLKEPERAFVDISIATLAGCSKNYVLKYSIF